MHSSRMRAVGVGVCQGVSARGVSAQGWCLPGVGGGVHLSLCTEFLTHACENITSPQLSLRTVMTLFCMFSYNLWRSHDLPFSFLRKIIQKQR